MDVQKGRVTVDPGSQTGPVAQEQLNDWIDIAAEAAHYQEGFGVKNCDLEQQTW